MGKWMDGWILYVPGNIFSVMSAWVFLGLTAKIVQSKVRLQKSNVRFGKIV